MKLSIVTTLYRSAAYIDEFYQRASKAARQITDDYEIVMVNDGSPDDSLSRAVRLTTLDPHIVVVDLSRNFGHQKAMMTAVAQAQGDLIFLIDSDLEEEPEWLLPFAEQLQREDCDVVYGVQARRKGGLFERITGQWFYRLFRLFTGLDLPENIVTARLMIRDYARALCQFDEREVFLGGLWHITGFEQQPHIIVKHSLSESTYTLRHKVSLLVNAVTSFSSAPLIWIFNLGVLISLGAFAYCVYLVVNWLFLSAPAAGWTSVMASIWLLGGMVISFIGIIGIYLSKVFSETKRRPYVIIRRTYRGQQQDE